MKSIFVLCYAACFLLLGADAIRRQVWLGGQASNQNRPGRRIDYDDAGVFLEDQVATTLHTARVGGTIPQAINGHNVVRFTFYRGPTPGIYPVATVTNENGPIRGGQILRNTAYRSFRVEAFARPTPMEPILNEALRDPASKYYIVDGKVDKLIGDPYRLNEIHKIQHRDLGKWEAVEGTPSGCNDVGSAGDVQSACVSSYVKAPDVPDTDCMFAVVCCNTHTLSMISHPTRGVISKLQLTVDCTPAALPSPKTDWTYAENTGGLNDKPLMTDCIQVVTNLRETAKNDEASLCHAAIWGSCAASVTQVQPASVTQFHGDPNCGDMADVVEDVIRTFYTNPGYPNGGWTGGSATGDHDSENDGLVIDVNKVPGVTTFSGEG